MEKKRSKPLILKDYLLAISDRIHSTNPSKEIIYNTVKPVWCDGFSRGVLWRISGASWFKDRQRQRFEERWNGLRDYIDDIIHNKTELKTKK